MAISRCHNLHGALVTDQSVCVCVCGQPAHACSYKIYKRGMQHTPRLTFRLTMGWNTLCNITHYPFALAECSPKLNKLFSCQAILSTRLGCNPLDPPMVLGIIIGHYCHSGLPHFGLPYYFSYSSTGDIKSPIVE